MQRKLSVFNVDVDASGETQYTIEDIRNVQEDNKREQATSDNKLELQYIRLEDSKVVGKFVMDYDPIISGVILVYSFK